ncbi:glutamyl-tRNA synthetase [Malonomonas rubra DSM 5091]|uniref:Glutamate--tRNA ligase n=1 Tax=Malonomonas rubra DSM 5091 TaxID=1122189 RepID=A0A1M6LHI7_MALRU|nr:glutamate--tRNA ligase [Malonomonas rubra]SHJ70654.1 glutamyl-tRNA synthetase [Malonomonas rubra DSM 5091]
MSDLRVRFAPSPTGYLHIGGARTALFNYLLAKQQGGTYVLRIEDTDVARSTQESVDAILDAMNWLGLSCDEGPFYQSERFGLYKEKVQQLIDEGKAYRCYCTQEELDAKREAAMKEGRKPKYDGTCRNRTDHPDAPYVIRFKLPEGKEEVAFDDRIKGRISVRLEELDDLIVARTDGTPTYNLVVVIDDAEMGINLVIRGDDHVNNTPRQILLYEALGYAVPEFAHVPMILGSDKKRLSKRHGATSVMAYQEEGFLPEAMVNYLVRLGWSYGDEEIFSMDDLIEKFSLDNVGRSAGVFNPEKLLWLNAHYIKTGDPVRLAELLKPFLSAKGIATEQGPDLVEAVKSLQERASTMAEMADGAAFYFVDTVEYEEKAKNKFLKAEQKPVFEAILSELGTCELFNEEQLEAAFAKIMDQTELKFGKVAQPLRVALTGGTASPSIYEVLQVLGKERALARIEQALATL